MKPHKSHGWVPFEEGEPEENMFCNLCTACTCHSPKIAEKRCKMTGGL